MFISLPVLHTFDIWPSTPDTASLPPHSLRVHPHCGRPTFIDKPHIVVASHLSSYRSSSLIKRQLPHNDRNLAISHLADPSSSPPVPIYGRVDIKTCKRNLLIITKIRLPGQFQPCSYTPLQIYCFGRDGPGPCLISAGTPTSPFRSHGAEQPIRN
jgi:hypothetical protein